MHHWHIVAEDVDFAEHVFEESLHALLVESLVDTCTLGATHNFLCAFRRATIVAIAHFFFNRHSEDRLSRNLGGVEVVENKFEFSHEPVFLLFLGEVVEAHGYFFIFVIVVVVVIFRVVAVLLRHEAFHKFHGRIVLFGVFFLFRFHHQLFESHTGGDEIDGYIVGFTFIDEYILCGISHCGNFEADEIDRSGDGKLPVLVGHDTTVGAAQENSHERERVASKRVAHHTFHHGGSDRVLCNGSRSRNNNTDEC